MAARGKARSVELSPSKQGLGRKTKAGSTLDDSGTSLDLERIVERAVQNAFSALKDELSGIVKNQLADFRAAFDERLKSVETTCKDLVQHAEYQASEYMSDVSQLRERVCELELALSRNELEANLVISGITESGSETEDTKAVVLATCRDVLNVQIGEKDVLEAVRLGAKRKDTSSNQSKPVRPRPILVKTVSRQTKSMIMLARKTVKLQGSGIYLNDDLSRTEQKTRKKMLPIYRELKSCGVRCRLDRCCLVVGARRFFNPQQVPDRLNDLQPEIHRKIQQIITQTAPASPTQ